MLYTGSITTLWTHIKWMAGEHYEEYCHSCRENNIPVNEVVVPDGLKSTGSGQEGQQSIANYTQVERKATAWDKDISIENILDFIIETDQVNDILTNCGNAVPNLFVGPQHYKYTIILEDDGISTGWKT